MMRGGGQGENGVPPQAGGAGRAAEQVVSFCAWKDCQGLRRAYDGRRMARICSSVMPTMDGKTLESRSGGGRMPHTPGFALAALDRFSCWICS